MELNQFKTSYSALDTFNQCPQKYKFQVIDKIKAPKSKEAVFGNKIHKALQFFHSKHPISPTLDELLNYLKDIWEPIVAQDEQEDMIYFSEAIKILKNYYNHYLKIKHKFTVIDTETRFEVLLENPQNKQQKCILTGIIDRIDKTADGIEIIDYKTTKRLPSQQDIDNNLQLSIYCLGLIRRWPQFAKQGLENIKLTFYYLKHQEAISTKRTKQQIDGIKEQIWKKLAEIEKSDFKPIPSSLCDWCGYKNICPMWKHKVNKKAISDQQIQKAIKEFLELKNQNQINNKRLTELNQIINNYLDQQGLERVFDDDMGYITRLTQIRKGGYDIKKLKKIIKTLPPPIRKQIKEAKKADKQYTILKVSLKKNIKNIKRKK